LLCFCYGQRLCLFHDLVGYPLRKRHLSRRVRATFGVFIPNFRQLSLSKPRRKLDHGGPNTPMDVRDFAVNQLADQNVGTVTNGSRRSKDYPALWVPPPTTSNGFAGDRLRKAWHGTTRRLEHDSMTLHERDCFFRTHFNQTSGMMLNSRTETVLPKHGPTDGADSMPE
jgi:hypothetical protein